MRSPKSSKPSAAPKSSLEAVQGTVEHVVDRLAMIESDMRVDRPKPAIAEPMPLTAQKPALGPLPISPTETELQFSWSFR